MAQFVEFDLGLPPRKRRVDSEKEIFKPLPIETEWSVVTKKTTASVPSLSPPLSQVKKYTYLSESELKDILSAHMKPQHGNLIKMAYLELKTPTQFAVEMSGKKGFSVAQIKKFYKIFRTHSPL